MLVTYSWNSSSVKTEIFHIVNECKARYRSWKLLGVTMSVKCIAAVSGIRSDRIKTAGDGMVDRRYGCFGGEPRCYCCSSFYSVGEFDSALDEILGTVHLEDKKRRPLKYMSLDKIFLRIYIQQAGMLPTQFLAFTGSIAT